MTESDTLDLSGLAPEIDLVASRALFERRRVRVRRRRRVTRGSVAAVVAIAVGLGVARWPDTQAELDTGLLDQPVRSAATDRMRSIEVDLLAAAGRIAMDIPDEFELLHHQGRLSDGSLTDGLTIHEDPGLPADPAQRAAHLATMPVETLAFDTDRRLDGPRPGDRQISVAIWPRSAVDISRFDPLDDSRFTYPAFYDTPPDPEWNKSVILQVDADTVMFVNGRNLDEETLLRIASSIRVERP
jgi:hypothetical protein